MGRLLLIIGLFIGGNIEAFCSSADDAFLEGFWYDSYPVNDSSGGFLFWENGSFTYFHQSNQNIERRYLGASGIWRINNDAIEIEIKRHYFLQNPVILQNMPSGKYAIGADNTVKYLDVDDSKWERIGGKKDFIIAHFPSLFVKKNTEDKGIELPCILLSQIDNGIITEKIKYYKTQKLSNLSADVIGTIDMFKKAKKGKKGEWYPGNPIQVMNSGNSTSK